MSGHTPGPWIYKTVQTSIGQAHKIGPEPITDYGHGCTCIYDDRTSLNPCSSEELEANARLIAAAPELLGALLLVRMSAGWQHMSDETKAVIEAAIAKARGHQ